MIPGVPAERSAKKCIVNNQHIQMSETRIVDNLRSACAHFTASTYPGL